MVNLEDPLLRLLISEGYIPAVAAYYKTRFAAFEQWQDVSADSDFEVQGLAPITSSANRAAIAGFAVFAYGVWRGLIWNV